MCDVALRAAEIYPGYEFVMGLGHLCIKDETPEAHRDKVSLLAAKEKKRRYQSVINRLQKWMENNTKNWKELCQLHLHNQVFLKI